MANKDLNGLGGWLVLVALGLVVTPVRVLLLIVGDLLPVFTQGHWAVLTTPGTDAYHPLWGPLLAFEVLGNLGVVAASIVGLTLFSRRSPLFPRFMVAFYLASLAFVAIDFFAADLMPAVRALDDASNAKELLRSVVVAAIWVPYMLVSRRVKSTFHRDLPSSPLSPELPAP